VHQAGGAPRRGAPLHVPRAAVIRSAGSRARVPAAAGRRPGLASRYHNDWRPATPQQASSQQLLAFRHDCTTVTTPAEQAAATARLTSATAELGKAADALHGLIKLAEMAGRTGRTGKTDLN
jgi:hypothetical protein